MVQRMKRAEQAGLHRRSMKGLQVIRDLNGGLQKRRERVATILGVQPSELPAVPRVLTKRDLPCRMAVAPCSPPLLTPLTQEKKPAAASHPVPVVASPWSSCAASNPWNYGSKPLTPHPSARSHWFAFVLVLRDSM